VLEDSRGLLRYPCPVIDPELLSILVCPDTHQPLAEADDATVQRMNAAIASGTARNVAGDAVSEAIDGGLVREDQKILYPVRDSIPVLLVEEGLLVQA